MSAATITRGEAATASRRVTRRQAATASRRVTRGEAATASATVILLGSAEACSEVKRALGQGGDGVSTFARVEQLAALGPVDSAELVMFVGEPAGILGSDVVAVAREQAPGASLVLVVETIDGWDVRRALARGVSGIVLIGELHSALAPCLAAVRSGQICVPAGNRRHLQRPVLSMREKQILGLVVMGYLNSQIAQRLYLAESTVKSHLTSAFGKLEVRSRHEAVDLILNPEFGLALGILSLGGEPVQEIASETVQEIASETL
jgi:DNA-binding NarL/FixJ family response regulator